MTTREAKELLIAQIVAEADRENQPLDGIERRMLYFNETGWMPADTWEANEAFERDYEEDGYERRVAQLSASLQQRPEYDAESWNQALRTLILSGEDHYLLVLIDPSLQEPAPTTRPRHDFIKLVLAAIACILLMFLAILAYQRFVS